MNENKKQLLFSETLYTNRKEVYFWTHKWEDTLRQSLSTLILNQDRQCTYNAILRRNGAIIVAVGK